MHKKTMMTHGVESHTNAALCKVLMVKVKVSLRTPWKHKGRWKYSVIHS